MLKKMWVAYWFVFVQFSVAEPSKTDTNREVIRTYAQIFLKTKNFISAESTLSQYLNEDPGDGELWNLYGLTLLSQKKFAQSCHAFRKAVTVYSDIDAKVNAAYNLAHCFFKGGQSKDAIQVLAEAEKWSLTYQECLFEVRGKLMKNELASHQDFPEIYGRAKSRLTGGFALGLGYDTNVLMLDDQVAGVTPMANRASPTYNPLVQLGYLGQFLGIDIDSRYIGSFQGNLADAASTFNMLYQRVDVLTGRGRLKWGVFGESLFMNRGSFGHYLWNGGAQMMKSWALSERSGIDLTVPIRYQKFPLDLTGDNDRTGGYTQARLQYRSLEDGGAFTQLGIWSDFQYSNGKNFRYAGMNLPAQWGVYLPFLENLGWMNLFTLEASGQWYFQNENKRKDAMGRAGVGLVVPLWEGVQSIWDVSVRRNFSTDSQARFSKVVYQVFFTKALF